MTTNHKNPPEAITKKKLAFEVAKFVKRYIKNIKVRATFAFVLSFSKPTWVGRTWLRRYNFRELGVDEIVPRVEGILATGTSVRGSYPPYRYLLKV